MIKSVLRTLLGKRVQDTVADQFDTTALDAMLDVGYSQYLLMIQKYNPTPFIVSGTFTFTSGTSACTKPATVDRIIRVETAAGVEVKRRNFLQLLEEDEADASDTTAIQYFDTGDKIFIRPAAASSATLTAFGTPVGTFASDSAVPLGNIALHPAIVDCALLELLGETSEKGEDVLIRLARAEDRMQTLYGTAGRQVQQLSIKQYAR